MLLARRRRATTILPSLGHAIDHVVPLIFASAAGAIAAATIALMLSMLDVEHAQRAPAAAAAE